MDYYIMNNYDECFYYLFNVPYSQFIGVTLPHLFDYLKIRINFTNRML